MPKKIRKYKNFKGRVVESTTHPLEIDLIYSFKNSNFANAIYLCVEKGFIYQKELNRILNIDSRSVINGLLRDGIIEQFELDINNLNKIALINNSKINNFKYLKSFKLSNKFKVILQHPYIYNLLLSCITIDLKQYVEDLEIKYNNKIAEIEQKKQLEEQKFMHRYEIAKQKDDKFKTADDWAIINMVERHI